MLEPLLLTFNLRSALWYLGEMVELLWDLPLNRDSIWLSGSNRVIWAFSITEVFGSEGP